MSITLKIIVCGPKGSGKSTLCNGICDYNNPIPSEYRSTKSVRILECEHELNDEQIKKNDFLSGKGITKVNIQLWDMGGDKSIEKLWPAIKSSVNGAILVIDGKNTKHDNIIDEWVNGFCLPEIDVERLVCISYHKDNQSDMDKEKQKTSNQFPKLKIFDTNYDLKNVLPIFHQFVDKLIWKLK